MLLKLEEIQAGRHAAPEPAEGAVRMSEAEEAAALALLESPDLLSRILEDFRRCGAVGEETNKLVGYIAAVGAGVRGVRHRRDLGGARENCQNLRTRRALGPHAPIVEDLCEFQDLCYRCSPSG